MDGYKLKMKIGEHEFEADGPTEVVQAQFQAFRDLVMAVATATPQRENRQQIEASQFQQGQNYRPGADSLMLDRIMKIDGRIVSLTARASSLEDEILLILLGQKNLRENESVTGAEIIDGLQRTGHVVNRIDYKLDRMSEGQSATVITVGTGRARRYRLTNLGFAKAQEVAMTLVERVA
jgi:hypothetical protein